MTPQEIAKIAHCKSQSQVKRVATQLKLDTTEAIRVWKEIEEKWKIEPDPLPVKEKPEVPL